MRCMHQAPGTKHQAHTPTYTCSLSLSHTHTHTYIHTPHTHTHTHTSSRTTSDPIQASGTHKCTQTRAHTHARAGHCIGLVCRLTCLFSFLFFRVLSSNTKYTKFIVSKPLFKCSLNLCSRQIFSFTHRCYVRYVFKKIWRKRQWWGGSEPGLLFCTCAVQQAHLTMTNCSRRRASRHGASRHRASRHTHNMPFLAFCGREGLPSVVSKAAGMLMTWLSTGAAAPCIAPRL